MLKTLLLGSQIQLKLLSKPSKIELGRWLSTKLEDAGPLYIKIGQFISSRDDIFGKELTSGLACLRDNTKYSSFEEISNIKELSELLMKVDNFSKKPIASASIAQVHTANLKNGKNIAIKIKKPKIEELIINEMKILKNTINTLKSFNIFGMIELSNILNDFEYNILQEFNYKQEILNILMFRKIYSDKFNDVYIPKVYPELSSDNIIVMEYVPSNNIFNITMNRKKKAEKLINIFLNQLLYEGILHGDPHAGNLGIRGNQIILYDFGNVIKISETYRNGIRDLLYYFQNKDIDKIIDTMIILGIQIKNKPFMKQYIVQYLEYIQTLDINKISITDIKATTKEEKIPVILDEITLKMLRSYTILEGICKRIDPNFTYSNVISENIELLFLDMDYIYYRIDKDIDKLLS